MTVPLRNRYLDQAMPFVAEWTSVTKLLARKQAWRALCDRAIDPNPFYSPEYLAACVALRGKDIRCVAIYRDGSRDSDLIGLFPLQRARVFDGALIPALEFFRNDYVCLTAPLVDRDAPQAVWDCFIDRCAHTAGAPQMILSRLCPATGDGSDALRSALALRNLPQCTIESYGRAAVAKPASFNAAFRGISSGRRTDLRRRRRKMRADGVAEMHTFRPGDPRMAEMVAAFLRIEAAGWKGKSGTAMACTAGTRAFAEAVFNAPDAELNVLFFNGDPISVDCMLVSQGVVSTVKAAYDETYATYAPGLLAGLHLIRQTAERPDIARIDSCAQESHVFNDVWLDRQAIAWFGFATSSAVPPARLDQMTRLVHSANRLKAWLKSVLHRH